MKKSISTKHRKYLIQASKKLIHTDLTQHEAEYQRVQICLEEIKNMKAGTPLDLFGRITFQGQTELVNIVTQQSYDARRYHNR